MTGEWIKSRRVRHATAGDHWSTTTYWRTRGVSLRPGGIAVRAETMGPWGNATERAVAAWPIGSRPFELAFEIDLDEVRWQTYFAAGMAVAICSRPPPEMTAEDFCVVCHVHFAGIAVSAWRGWFLDDDAVQLSPTTGGGDNLESAAWHFRHVRDARLRVVIDRDANQQLRWRVWSDTLPELNPWIDERWTIPDELAGTKLSTLVVQRTPVRPSHYGYPGFAVAGRVTRIAGRPGRCEPTQADRPDWDGWSDWPMAADEATRGKPGSHRPRLLWDEAGREAIAERWNDPAFEAYRTQIEQAGQSDEPQPLAMLLVADLNGDSDVAERLMSRVREICRNRDAIDFAGSDWILVAQVFDTWRDRLSPADKHLLLGYLRFMLHTAPLCHDDWFWNPRHNPSNTTAVANAGAGMVALALLDDAPEARAQAIAAREVLKRFAQRCTTPDGGYIEGTLYWAYALNHYLTFLDAWRRCGIDPSMNDLDASLAINGRYAEAVVGGDGRMVTFGDTQPWLTGASVMAFLDRELDQPVLRALAAEAVRAGPTRFVESAFLFHRDAPPPQRPPALPLVSALPELQLATLRSDRTFVPAMSVSITGTPSLLSHHKQADAGSVILSAGGQPVWIDPGYYQPAAASHSNLTLIVDGRRWDPRPGVPTRWIGHGSIGSVRWAAVDLSDTFAEAAAAHGAASAQAVLPTVRRTVLLSGTAVVVVDQVGLTGQVDQASVEQRWQWAGKPMLDHGRLTFPIGPGQHPAVAVRGVPRWNEPIESAGPLDFGESWIFRRMADAGQVGWYQTTHRIPLTGTGASRTVTGVTIAEFGGVIGKTDCQIDGVTRVRLPDGTGVQVAPNGLIVKK